MVRDCKVTSAGLSIEFSFPLDVESATSQESYEVLQWDYRRQKSYGSEKYSPSTGKVGADPMRITSISLGANGQSVHLNVPDLQPVDQVHLILRLKARDGEDFAVSVGDVVPMLGVRLRYRSLYLLTLPGDGEAADFVVGYGLTFPLQ